MENEQNSNMNKDRNSRPSKFVIAFCRCCLVLSLVPLGFFVATGIVELLGNDVDWMVSISLYTITPIFGFLPTICLLIVAVKGKTWQYIISGLIIFWVNLALFALEVLCVSGLIYAI